MKRTLIIAAVLLSTVAFALPASSENIESYIGGPWLEFGFGLSNTPAISGAGFVPSSGSNSVFLDDPAWTFTLAGLAELRITDVFQNGDSFEVFDNLVSVVQTPYVLPLGYCGSDPEACYGVSGVSHASLILGQGIHSLTIKVIDSPYGSGAAFFRIDNIISTPEPCTLLLMGLGLVGLAASRRKM